MKYIQQDPTLMYDESLDVNRKDGWKITNKVNYGVDGSLAYGGKLLNIIDHFEHSR
jgi:hypothetical protein